MSSTSSSSSMSTDKTSLSLANKATTMLPALQTATANVAVSAVGVSTIDNPSTPSVPPTTNVGATQARPACERKLTSKADYTKTQSSRYHEAHRAKKKEINAWIVDLVRRSNGRRHQQKQQQQHSLMSPSSDESNPTVAIADPRERNAFILETRELNTVRALLSSASLVSGGSSNTSVEGTITTTTTTPSSSSSTPSSEPWWWSNIVIANPSQEEFTAILAAARSLASETSLKDGREETKRMQKKERELPRGEKEEAEKEEEKEDLDITLVSSETCEYESTVLKRKVHHGIVTLLCRRPRPARRRTPSSTSSSDSCEQPMNGGQPSSSSTTTTRIHCFTLTSHDFFLQYEEETPPGLEDHFKSGKENAHRSSIISSENNTRSPPPPQQHATTHRYQHLPAFYDFVWLDYCGTIDANTRAGRRRIQDLQRLFRLNLFTPTPPLPSLVTNQGTQGTASSCAASAASAILAVTCNTDRGAITEYYAEESVDNLIDAVTGKKSSNLGVMSANVSSRVDVSSAQGVVGGAQGAAVGSGGVVVDQDRKKRCRGREDAAEAADMSSSAGSIQTHSIVDASTTEPSPLVTLTTTVLGKKSYKIDRAQICTVVFRVGGDDDDEGYDHGIVETETRTTELEELDVDAAVVDRSREERKHCKQSENNGTDDQDTHDQDRRDQKANRNPSKKEKKPKQQQQKKSNQTHLPSVRAIDRKTPLCQFIQEASEAFARVITERLAEASSSSSTVSSSDLSSDTDTTEATQCLIHTLDSKFLPVTHGMVDFLRTFNPSSSAKSSTLLSPHQIHIQPIVPSDASSSVTQQGLYHQKRRAGVATEMKKEATTADLAAAVAPDSTEHSGDTLIAEAYRRHLVDSVPTTATISNSTTGLTENENNKSSVDTAASHFSVNVAAVQDTFSSIGPFTHQGIHHQTAGIQAMWLGYDRLKPVSADQMLDCDKLFRGLRWILGRIFSNTTTTNTTAPPQPTPTASTLLLALSMNHGAKGLWEDCFVDWCVEGIQRLCRSITSTSTSGSSAHATAGPATDSSGASNCGTSVQAEAAAPPSPHWELYAVPILPPKIMRKNTAHPRMVCYFEIGRRRAHQIEKNEQGHHYLVQHRGDNDATATTRRLDVDGRKGMWDIYRLPKIPSRDTDVFTKSNHYLLPIVKALMIAAANAAASASRTGSGSMSDEGHDKKSWHLRLWFHEPGFLRALPHVMSIRSSRDSRSTEKAKKQLLLVNNKSKLDSMQSIPVAAAAADDVFDGEKKGDADGREEEQTGPQDAFVVAADLLTDGCVTIECLTDGDTIQAEDLKARYPSKSLTTEMEQGEGAQLQPQAQQIVAVSTTSGASEKEEQPPSEHQDTAADHFRVHSSTLSTNDCEWIDDCRKRGSRVDVGGFHQEEAHQAVSNNSDETSSLSSSRRGSPHARGDSELEGMIVLCDGGPSRLKKRWWKGILQWWWGTTPPSDVDVASPTTTTETDNKCENTMLNEGEKEEERTAALVPVPLPAALFLMVHVQRTGSEYNVAEMEALTGQLKVDPHLSSRTNSESEEGAGISETKVEKEEKDVISVEFHPEVYNCGRYYQCVSIKRVRFFQTQR